MLTDEEIFTGFAHGSPLNREAGSMAEVDEVALAALCEAAGDADDPMSLAALPEAPEPVLESARSAFTADAPGAIAAIYAGHCQPRVEIEDYDADGKGGLYARRPLWRVKDCPDMSALSAALYRDGAQ